MPIDYDRRCRALLSGLDADAFLLVNLEDSDRVSQFYLAGFTGEGVLLLSNEGLLLLTDSRYTEQAGREVPTLTLKEVKGNYVDEVATQISALGVSRVAFAAKRMSHYWVERLGEQIDAELISLEDPVGSLRRVKEPEEIDRIREATRITEAALTELASKIKAGMSERDLAVELEILIRRSGAEKVAFDLIVAAGENSALPHYRPGMRRLRTGDLLLFDIGAQVEGYCSDMTRVFVVGTAPARVRKIYDLVLSANRAGVAAIQAGADGKAVDAVARGMIDEAGHKEHFRHGLGHGVGLEVHEAPRLSSLSEDTLEAGMVVTVEPGVYLPGFGGVRIEDLVVVGNDGCEVLTSFQRDRLIEVG